MWARRRFVWLVIAATLFMSGYSVAEPLSVRFAVNDQQLNYVSIDKNSPYTFNSESKKTVVMATLDWPPYISDFQCNKGWVFQLGVALMLSKGYSVTVHFLPWARAVKEVESGNMDILFPEYYIEPEAPSDVYKNKKRLDSLSLSRAFPGGEIAFMKRPESKVLYDGDLKTLVGESIGVVRGYQNTPEFDRMMDAGQFTIMHAVNDLQLAKLLYAKRVNLILADPTVLYYTVKHSNEPDIKVKNIIDNMVPLQPTLDYKYLYFAISKRKKNWQRMLYDINDALVNFDHSGQLNSIIHSESNQCEPH